MKFLTSPRGRFLTHEFLILLFMCAVATVYICSFEIWNSDVVITEALFQDLRTGTSWMGWRLPPAPSMFPDWAVYFALRWITQGANFALASYVYLSVIIYFYFSGQLLEKLIGEKPNPFFPYGSFLTFLVLWPKLWLVLFIPTHHGGVFLISLAFINYYEKYVRGSWPVKMLIGIALFLSGMSDYFIIVWLVAPLLICEFILYKQKRINKKELLIRGRELISILIAAYIMKPSFLNLLGFQSHLQNSTSMLNSYFDLEKAIDLFQYFGGYKLTVILLIPCVYIFLKHDANKLGSQELWKNKINLHSFLILSSVLSVAFVLAFSLFVDPENVRYLYPIYLTVMLFISRFFFYIYKNFLSEKLHRPGALLRCKRSILAAALIILVVFCGVNEYVVAFEKSDFSLISHQEFEGDQSTQCLYNHLTKTGLISEPGLSTYWPYKMTLVLSGMKLRALQVNEGLEPYAWLTNLEWSKDISIQSARFILIDSAQETPVLQNLERSHKTVTGKKDCLNFKILEF